MSQIRILSIIAIACFLGFSKCSGYTDNSNKDIKVCQRCTRPSGCKCRFTTETYAASCANGYYCFPCESTGTEGKACYPMDVITERFVTEYNSCFKNVENRNLQSTKSAEEPSFENQESNKII